MLTYHACRTDAPEQEETQEETQERVVAAEEEETQEHVVAAAHEEMQERGAETEEEDTQARGALGEEEETQELSEVAAAAAALGPDGQARILSGPGSTKST